MKPSFSFHSTVVLPQQAAPDTGQVAPDTLAADTSAVDTVGAISTLSREVGETGRLLIEGKWELVLNRLYDGLGGLAVAFIPKLLSALFVFIFFYILYRIFGSILHRMLERSRKVEPGLQSLLLKSYRVVALSFITLMVLANFDINITALLAGFSIVGIAVGFAAKDTLENFISGVTILLDRPFRVGDRIVIEGIYGTVEEITLRSTRVRTLNNEILVMPNIQMINQKLINHTMLGILRVEIPFGIAYKEYPEEARKVVLRLTEGDDRLHPNYPPECVVTGLGDSSVDMSLRLYLKNPLQEMQIKYEYVEKVREALRAADIEIPFPHRQLFLDEAKGLREFPLFNRNGEPASRPVPPDASDGD
ncbi:mechanosensitive ion channel family protein [Rhodocaloribacter litoris]|uniref:mechanosensitive ion channel family protein n=1 Tax=Rhodocaloribacter litoris TaxID=2558931 RepID=UPI0014227A47|nr:mechanosensitive ion channel family protein [Rhodocaloribacter litoris]QXD14614.1 mechanosensitive ion channel family protein [Rhodocaloribacter litoris]